MALTEEMEKLENEWYEKTKGKGGVWAKAVKGTEDDWAARIAAKLGVSESDIKGSTAYERFKKFADNADDYVDDFEKGVESAHSINKFVKRYAFKMTGKKY